METTRSVGSDVLVLRIRRVTIAFSLCLAASGATAIPIRSELEVARDFLGRDFRGGDRVPDAAAAWLSRVSQGVEAQAPFLPYGTDWLAFGHLGIAIAFFGAIQDPVRNRWLFRYGLILCALVPPWALVFGALRGIPWWWRLIDASFGLAGAPPLFLCSLWARELEERSRTF
jgi:hypothetical protein